MKQEAHALEPWVYHSRKLVMLRLRVKEIALGLGIPDAAELSRRTGIAYATAYRLWAGDVGGVKRGERSVGIMTLYRVAQALNRRTCDLFTEDEPTA